MRIDCFSLDHRLDLAAAMAEDIVANGWKYLVQRPVEEDLEQRGRA